MKQTIYALLVSTILATSASATEQDVPITHAVRSHFDIGVALSAVSTRDASVALNIFKVTDGQDRLGNVTFLAGYDYNAYIGLEGRYTTTITAQDAVKMQGWSLFIKPVYPVAEAFDIYGLLGYGGITMDPSSNHFVDVSDNGFQWGLGIDYRFGKTVSAFFDYTSLAKDMDGLYWNGAHKIDADAFTVGIRYAF